jgi:hypothetical protein
VRHLASHVLQPALPGGGNAAPATLRGSSTHHIEYDPTRDRVTSGTRYPKGNSLMNPMRNWKNLPAQMKSE